MRSPFEIPSSAKRFTALIGFIAGFLAFLYISTVFFYPFMLAFLFSLMFVPWINFIENRWGWNRSLATLAVIGSFIVVLLTVITFLVAELIYGLSYLTRVLPDYIEDIAASLYEWGKNTWPPLISQFTESQHAGAGVNFSLEQLMNEAGVQAGSLIYASLTYIKDFLTGFPHAVTMILFSLLAAFFISKDWPRMSLWLENHLPARFHIFAGSFLDEWKSSLGQYIKAQLLLVSITGIIVFTGLMILQVNYAFTTALLIAAVDILPYTGTGLVFIPWIIYSMIYGNWHMSAGLAVLYGVVVLQRQLTEPKIVAHHMGVPALVFLFAMFACYQFFGFTGVLAAPFIIIFINSLIKADIIGEVRLFLQK